MRFLIIFGFLHWTDAQSSQSYPDPFIPDNLGNIKKVIDVTFTHNLPNSFDLREEDDYSWSYFTTGMVHHRLWSIELSKIWVMNMSYLWEPWKEFAGYGLDGSEESNFISNFKTSIRDASFVDITFTLTFNAEDFRQSYVAADVESKSNILKDKEVVFIRLTRQIGYFITCIKQNVLL